MRAAFLDVDGVVRHAKFLASEFPASRPEHRMDRFSLYLINKLLEINRKIESTEIVVSATLRLNYEIPELRKLFRDEGLCCDVLDATGYGPPPGWSCGRRGGEIHSWLLAHPEVTSFAIIDDEISDLGILRPWAAHVKNGYFTGGIKGYHVKQALDILRVPLGFTYAEAYNRGFPNKPLIVEND